MPETTPGTPDTPGSLESTSPPGTPDTPGSPGSPDPLTAWPGRCLLIAAATFAIFCVSLAFLHIDPNYGPYTLKQLAFWFWPAYLVVWLSLTALTRCRFPRLSTRQTAFVILFVAAAARLFTVANTDPQLSDDIYRYMHDGIILSAGQNPYALAPSEMRPFDNVHGLIKFQVNNPDLVTIYQPTSQWVFAAAMSVGRSDKLMRATFVLFDLAVIAMLMVKLRREGLNVLWAALYAWHPLPITEIAASGHQDIIGIALMLAALLLAETATQSRKHALLAGIALAMAVAVKPFVLPLALPLALAVRHDKRTLAAAVLGALLAGIALYLPFAMMPAGLTRLFETSDTFVGNWLFNGSIHLLMVNVGVPFQIAHWLSLTLLTITFITCLCLRLDVWRTACIFLFASLLLSSTAYPWYLLWSLAFLPIRFSKSLWLYSLTTVLSYEVWSHASNWEVPPWLALTIYVPVFTAIVWEIVTARRQAASE